MIRWLGALLIVGACGSFGFSLASGHRREEAYLRSMVFILDYLQCELHFRMTPLPDLCREAGGQNKSQLGQVFLALAEQLERQNTPDVTSCVTKVLANYPTLPEKTKNAFGILGSSLGRFDVQGQIMGLETVRQFCRRELELLGVNRTERLRSYQTLGLCAGAALAIIFV